MAGVKALRKIQLGRETTAGTAVAATTIWRGLGTMEDRREVVFPEETVGYLSGLDRAYTPYLAAGLTMESVPATFEQLPHILEAGIATVTATTDGSGYVRTYTLATTTVPTIKTYTIEAGDDQQEEEMEYSFVESFRLEGKAKEAVMVSADWVGRQVTASSFTTGISVPTVEEILFLSGKLYIDATTGTIGTTQKTQTLLGMTLDVKCGLVPVFSADGSLHFTFLKSVPAEVTLQLTFEHDSTSTAEKSAWRAGTSRLIQLKFEGSALQTAGTTYSKKTLIVNLAGRWEKFDKLGEQDGNDIVTGTFRARYNPTAARFAQIIVVNEVSSL